MLRSGDASAYVLNETPVALAARFACISAASACGGDNPRGASMLEASTPREPSKSSCKSVSFLASRHPSRRTRAPLKLGGFLDGLLFLWGVTRVVELGLR